MATYVLNYHNIIIIILLLALALVSLLLAKMYSLYKIMQDSIATINHKIKSINERIQLLAREAERPIAKAVTPTGSRMASRKKIEINWE